MELRQLRYFVAVADDLHFGRAAQRLHISGPALSQQIIALERDLGVQLFVRDRRGVQLTAGGHSLLTDARQIIGLAASARTRVQQAATLGAPLRLGYVSWLPDDLAAIIGPSVAVRVDDWVLPSHAQAERVATGTLDLAVVWISLDDVEHNGLSAHLLYAEPLHAVLPGAGSREPVTADRLCALVDADESAWSSWNRFAEEFAADTGARIARIDDGGIIGEAFYGHVRRIGSAVLASPKRNTAAVPPVMGQRPVDPVPLWNWSLLHRSDDERPAVRHIVQSLLAFAASRHWTSAPHGRWWAPSGDPHRPAAQSLSDLS